MRLHIPIPSYPAIARRASVADGLYGFDVADDSDDGFHWCEVTE
jgi:hypothetical protein